MKPSANTYPIHNKVSHRKRFHQEMLSAIECMREKRVRTALLDVEPLYSAGDLGHDAMLLHKKSHSSIPHHNIALPPQHNTRVGLHPPAGTSRCRICVERSDFRLCPGYVSHSGPLARRLHANMPKSSTMRIMPNNAQSPRAALAQMLLLADGFSLPQLPSPSSREASRSAQKPNTRTQLTAARKLG
jgi:hypothetical protein